MFLFYSGYGLAISVFSKKQYLKKMLFVRIPHIVFTYLVVNGIYYVIRRLTGTLHKTSIAGYLLGGQALVTYSWYIICLLYLYVLFLISFFVFKKNKRTAYCCLTLGVLAWIGSMWVAGGGIHRYNAVAAFLFGCAIAESKSLQEWFSLKYRTVFSFITFIITFVAATFCWATDRSLFLTWFFMATAGLSFTVIVVTLPVCRWNCNRFFGFLGSISLEFYLCQGALMLLTRGGLIYVQNDILFCVLVFVGTLALALAVHYSNLWLLARWKNYLKSFQIQEV